MNDELRMLNEMKTKLQLHAKYPPNSNDTNFRIAAWTAGVAGVLAIVVCALMAYDYSRRLAKDPLESATFIALRNTLSQQPTNEELKKQIRAIDLELRTRILPPKNIRRRRRDAVAGQRRHLSSGGQNGRHAASPIAAAAAACDLGRHRNASGRGLARWGVAGLMAILAVAVLVLNFASRSPLPGSEEALAAMLGESKNAAQSQ